MPIKEFIKRKPIHKPTAKKPTVATKKDEEVALRYDDPFLWCTADKGLVDDPVIYIDFDSETDTIESIIIEGNEVL